MTGLDVVWVVAALTLAGFLQGLSGFGFGLTAMALLPLVIGFSDAQAIVTVVNIAACVINAWALRRHLQWRDTTGLLAGSLIGVPIGFLFLTSLPLPIVKRCLGGALCLMVVFDFVAIRRMNFQYPTWISPLLGLAGGSLGGAFNIGGPPIVAYLYSQPWSKQRIVAALSLVFLTNGLVRMALLASGDFLHAGVWLLSGWSVAPMLFAILLGNRLLDRVSQQHLRMAVYAVLGFIGLSYLLGPATGS